MKRLIALMVAIAIFSLPALASDELHQRYLQLEKKHQLLQHMYENAKTDEEWSAAEKLSVEVANESAAFTRDNTLELTRLNKELEPVIEQLNERIEKQREQERVMNRVLNVIGTVEAVIWAPIWVPIKLVRKLLAL